MQAVGLLLEGGLGDDLVLVFQPEVVLPQHADLRCYRRHARSGGRCPSIRRAARVLSRSRRRVSSSFFLVNQMFCSLVMTHGTDAIDGLAVDEHPESHLAQALFLLDGQFAIRFGAHVQQQVAALGARLDKQSDESPPDL